MDGDRRRRGGWLSWLLDDLSAIAAQLRRRETWVFIGAALAFGLLGGVSLYYATGLDVSLQLRHLQKISCASASNARSAAIIIGGSAFFLAGIAALGELATFIDNRRAHRPAGATTALGLTALALVFGALLLWLLMSICG